MKTAGISIPQKKIEKWQGIVNLISEIVKFPVALIIKMELPEAAAFASSESGDNPYEHDQRRCLNTVSCCETVLKSRQPSLSPSALNAEPWKMNHDAEKGLISCLELPITWSNGHVFGTIGVLDNCENARTDLYQKLLLQFRDVVESDLRNLFNRDVRLAEELRIKLEESEKSRRALLSVLEDAKQMEIAMRESEERFQAALKISPVMFFTQDRELRYTWINPSGLAWREQDLLGKTDAEIFEGEEGAHLMAVKQHVLDTGAGIRAEVPVTFRGEKHYFDLTVEPVCDSHGTVIGITCACTDVTPLKKAEEALHQSEERFAMFMRFFPGCVFSKDQELRHRYVNEQFKEVFGIRLEDWLGKKNEEIWAADIAEKLSRDDKLVLESGNPIQVVEEVSQKGEPHSYLTYKFPIRIPGRDPLLGGIAIDITDLKRAQDALRQAEQKYRSIFDNAAEGIFQSTPQGRFLTVNPALARILGYSTPEEVLTMIQDIAHQLYVNPDRQREHARRLKERGFVVGFECEFRRKDGSTVWVSLSTRAVRDPEGKLLHYEGVVEEITERKRAEEELRQLSGHLLRMRDEERRHIARELHDATGQSMAGLVLNLGVLKKSDIHLDLNARKALEESLMLARSCSQEIRTLSYLLHPPMLDEFGLASALRWYVRGFSDRSGINVTLDMPRQLNRLPEEIETALFRIVQESLSNIRQHSKSKRAEIRLALDSTEVRLEVKDYGRGFRFDPAKAKIKGVRVPGVGIPGMRERVKQLGGEFRVQSARKGTLLKVILPLRNGCR